MLSQVNWKICEDTLLNCWNDFENILIKIVDKLAPKKEFSNSSVKHNPPPRYIQRKINSRRRALKQFKIRPTTAQKIKIEELNTEINIFFISQKRLAVKRGITPGNTLSLWSAVKIAKDIHVAGFLGVMYLNNSKILNANLAKKFADFLKTKLILLSWR